MFHPSTKLVGKSSINVLFSLASNPNRTDKKEYWIFGNTYKIFRQQAKHKRKSGLEIFVNLRTNIYIVDNAFFLYCGSKYQKYFDSKQLSNYLAPLVSHRCKLINFWEVFEFCISLFVLKYLKVILIGTLSIWPLQMKNKIAILNIVLW